MDDTSAESIGVNSDEEDENRHGARDREDTALAPVMLAISSKCRGPCFGPGPYRQNALVCETVCGERLKMGSKTPKWA